MALHRRVWGVGKLLLLLLALLATFFVFAAAGMRIALRAREVHVPNVLGHSVDEATRMMGDLGLGVRVDTNRRIDAQVPEGHILQQDPPAGAEARSQRTVRVWLSGGARAATVPELVGQTERTARIRLEQAGLTVKAVAEVRLAGYGADAIVAQEPAPTTRTDNVSLLINRGEQSVRFVMPDLIGIDGGRAADLLRSRGFRVSIVGQQPYQGIPPGTIIRQQPSNGFQVGPGDAISLEVSR
jgi:serine/threonine-protein kinase